MLRKTASKHNTYKWLVILFLFTSVDTVLFGTNSNRTFLWVPRIVGAFGVVWLFLLSGLYGKRLLIGEKLFVSFVIMLIFFCASCIYNQITIVTSLSRLIAIVLAFSLSSIISERVFLDSFDEFLFCISIIALITEAVAYLFPNFMFSLPSTINTAGKRFATFFFGGILLTDNLGKTFVRASSIFWEPGAYAFYLLIGIMFQLFRKKSPNVKHLATYICCLIITFSTTGYIVLGVIIIGYIISGRMKNQPKIINYMAILGVVLLFSSSLFSTESIIYELVFSKLFNGSSSATTRYSSFFNGLKVAFSHPILGVGTDLDKYMFEFVNSSKYTNGGLSITNTIVAQFAAYGFVFGFIFLFGTIRFFKKWATTSVDFFFLAVAILLSYMGERFYSFLPFTFVFYGLSHENRGITGENRGY